MSNYLATPCVSLIHPLTFEANSRGLNLKDIDFIIVPLYEKMFLTADIVIEKIRMLLKSDEMPDKKNLVLRVYLTSSCSFKKRTSENSTVNKDLKDIILRLPMPKFIWCADIASIEEFKDFKTSRKIIIDATAGKYEKNPWILIHDAKSVKYFDSTNNKWLNKNIEIVPYNMYQNNLKKVRGGVAICGV